ncbi:uncharacterized protein LOC111875462 isoform X2 [Cryptotermes secundus]|uniref:uncharacterized protein LOC111875462 isoform X2 n=1 Tax=Cryptotermes secundus TaxID=105785 RepID=UPI000CD7BFBC|nr:uncharacterized protein LOC111875462 isoform X2 [Cryptotermes secundus]
MTTAGCKYSISTKATRRVIFHRNVFSSNKGKSMASEDIDRVSSSASSRFMTWTPKLLRKASFRQSSRSKAAEFLGPRGTLSPIMSRLSFRNTASQRMVPPASSRSSLPPSASPASLHSSKSRVTLPPSHSPNAFSSSKLTSPPGRPAAPNVRTSLSPSRSLLAPAVAPSTGNAPNNVNTGSNQTAPVLAVGVNLCPASPSEKIVGEQASENETKYIQQGAKPKKKRRAPAPPMTSPGKSTSDNRQFNSNESDASMTSSVTSSSAEEPSPYDQSAAATSDLEVICQEPELDSKNRESDSPDVKEPEQLKRKQLSSSEKSVPEHHFEKGAEHSDRPENTEKELQELVHTHVSEHSERRDKMNDGKCAFRKDDDNVIVDNGVREEYPSSKSENGNLKLQSTFGNELQENGSQPEDGNLSFQQGWKVHKAKSSAENESTDDRNELDDGVRNTETSIKIPESFAVNTYRQNGKNFYSKNVDVQNEGKLHTEHIKQTKQLTPEPKPRTTLRNMIKN